MLAPGVAACCALMLPHSAAHNRMPRTTHAGYLGIFAIQLILGRRAGIQALAACVYPNPFGSETLLRGDGKKNGADAAAPFVLSFQAVPINASWLRRRYALAVS